MEKDVVLRNKAELILGGSVKLPKDYKVPVRISRSTAGPGAGTHSVVFAFNGVRVKKTVSYDEGDFELHSDRGTLFITRKGKPFLYEVKIEPVVFHCPEQAFFNLDQRCIYNCAYCTSPLLDKNITKDLTDEKIVNMIEEASKTQKIKSIALTSGVVGSVQETVDRFVSCIGKLRAAFPETPIGVEPYVDSTEQIDALHNAGATEIKINCEAARKDIFEKVCPGLDYDNIFRMLEYAVSVFGKGAVTSNVIYGLGESDDDLIEIMVRLGMRGVAPGLRALKQTPVNKEGIHRALDDIAPITPERMIYLAKEQKEIFRRYDLDTRSFKTMCFECTCCDLVPFKDL
ncbi:MAG: radical SAM protein [Candidatus Methanomethylophilaceae archaeon]